MQGCTKSSWRANSAPHTCNPIKKINSSLRSVPPCAREWLWDFWEAGRGRSSPWRGWDGAGELPVLCLLHPAFTNKTIQQCYCQLLPWAKSLGMLLGNSFPAWLCSKCTTGELEEHRTRLLWEFPPLSIFQIVCPSLQHCPLLALSTWKLSQGLVGNENQKSVWENDHFNDQATELPSHCLGFDLFPWNSGCESH